MVRSLQAKGALRPGRIDYHDPLHPQMRGTLVVTERGRAAHPLAGTPCGEVAASARHEIGDLEGDMARDTQCRARR